MSEGLNGAKSVGGSGTEFVEASVGVTGLIQQNIWIRKEGQPPVMHQHPTCFSEGSYMVSVLFTVFCSLFVFIYRLNLIHTASMHVQLFNLHQKTH